MLIHYVYHIWFKVCRFAKKKYKLSTNCLLVLNGCYVYSKVINKPFTRSKILKFCSYYNMSKIGTYLTVLMSKGYLQESGKYNNCYQLYVISSLGVRVIEELNNSYELQLLKFYNDNNIVL